MGGAAGSRRRAAHLGPEKRRPLVLDAALRLFAEHGYAGTSMEMVAEAAGVTKPVVYDCYSSKRELFEALLDREEQRLLDQMARALPSEPDFSDTERVMTDAYRAFLDAAVSAPDSWRVVFFSEHGAEPAVARRVARDRRMATERIAALTQAFLEGRGLPDARRWAILNAHMIVGSAEAAVRLLLEHPDEWDPASVARVLGASAGRMAAELERTLRR
jgi:AcrR family transcriptional regulator